MAEAIAGSQFTGYREGTLVVVVSDHGDEIGEHGLYGHNFAIYDTLVHVPLVLRGPGVATGHLTAPTSTPGLYGALASLVGIPVEGALTLESAPPVAEQVGMATRRSSAYGWARHATARTRSAKPVSSGCRSPTVERIRDATSSISAAVSWRIAPPAPASSNRSARNPRW
jgi:arylsulfatase A-like enzyme